MKKIKNLVHRWFIEDAKEIIFKSKKIVAILTYGDPFMATTMNELCKSKKNLIEIKIIHGLLEFIFNWGNRPT